MKKIFTFILATFIIGTAFGQSKYEKLLEQKKYEKAWSSLKAAFKKDPNDIECCFFLGKLCATPAFSNFNTDSAYFYFTLCGNLLDDVTDVRIKLKLQKLRISVSLVTREKNALENIAFKEVSSQNTQAAYQSFIDNYPKSRYAREAKRRFDQLEFSGEMNSSKDLQDYFNFLVRHPENSYAYNLADSVYDVIRDDPSVEMFEKFIEFLPGHDDVSKAWDALYHLYMWDGELFTLQQFMKKYPDYPNRSNYALAYENAYYAWSIGLTAAIPSEIKKGSGSNDSTSIEDEELNRRLTREGAKSGDLQFSLMWNNYNDIDLHVMDPFDEIIYYSNRKSASSGELDVDMNVQYCTGHFSKEPIENIYWGQGKAPAGHYRVYVVHYRNHQMANCDDPTPYSVRVRINGQDTIIKGSLVFTHPLDRRLVYEFDYFMQEKVNLEFNNETMVKYENYIHKAAPRELAYVAMIKLMEASINQGNWDKAILILRNDSKYFLQNSDINLRIAKLTKLLQQPTSVVNKEVLGVEINTSGEEYSPVISADDQHLYFCGRGRKDSLGKEDIYVSRFANGKWQKSQRFPTINTANGNEAPLSVSADGNTILMFKGGDIYFSSKITAGWSELKKFSTPVNTAYWEGDAMLTADGKAIIFASNRPGGHNLHTDQNYYHGGANYASDIYVCERTPEGWSTAINIGSIINTAFCERSSFLHPDMKTLYFSSDGHYGLGDLDVFKSTRISDTSWTQWTEPLNIGKNINTSGPDWGYCINTSGKYAYFSARDKNSNTREDIRRLSLPDSMRPQTVVIIHGRITDSHNQAVNATIHWEDLSENREIGSSVTDPEDGSYTIVLPAGRIYGYYAESEGYYPSSENLDLRSTSRFEEFTEDITIIHLSELIDSGRIVRINNLFFDTDKSILRPESYPELDRLSFFLKSIPEFKVEIMGHTDDQGPDDYNQKLSESRAKAVLDYLVLSGIDRQKLLVRGYGKKKPIAVNNTETGRQLNRRVEFRFLK